MTLAMMSLSSKAYENEHSGSLFCNALQSSLAWVSSSSIIRIDLFILYLFLYWKFYYKAFCVSLLVGFGEGDGSTDFIHLALRVKQSYSRASRGGIAVLEDTLPVGLGDGRRVVMNDDTATLAFRQALYKQPPFALPAKGVERAVKSFISTL